MGLPAFATLEHLKARGVDVSDAARAQAALNDASALIRSEAGTGWVSGAGSAEEPYVVDFGDMDPYLQDDLVAVTVAVARRVLENPQGASAMSLGDASLTLANSTSDVYLTASERRRIRRAGGAGGVSSVQLEVGTPGYSGTYIDVGQTEPMPFTYEPLRP